MPIRTRKDLRRFHMANAILFVAAFFISNIAAAHPHSWITLEAEFFLNDQHQLVQIDQHWKFDTYYSLISLADIKNSYSDIEQGLQATADAMATNLKDFGYFSNLKINDVAIPLAKPIANLTVEGEGVDAVLELSMQFVLDKPADLIDHNVRWSVFDPTYYIAMNHESITKVKIISKAGVECGKELALPNPTDEQIDYAGSLDQTQRDTQGLGDLFAEIVKITCI